MASSASGTACNYDLFLSYNSADQRFVEEIAHKLVESGLKELFFDRWNLLIGTRWRPALDAVGLSPDNHWLATGSADKTVRLWDLRAKDPAASPVVLRGHQSAVYAVGISADNHWLVTGSYDHTARLWDLGAKDPAANPIVLRGHEVAVWAVAISLDNRWVVTGSADKTARLWDLTAKDPAASSVVLRGHEKVVYAVAISPDNHWLVTGSGDNTARLWPLQMNDWINLARITVRRNFSADEWQLYFPGEKYRRTFDELPGLDESVTQKKQMTHGEK